MNFQSVTQACFLPFQKRRVRRRSTSRCRLRTPTLPTSSWRNFRPCPSSECRSWSSQCRWRRRTGPRSWWEWFDWGSLRFGRSGNRWHLWEPKVRRGCTGCWRVLSGQREDRSCRGKLLFRHLWKICLLLNNLVTCFCCSTSIEHCWYFFASRYFLSSFKRPFSIIIFLWNTEKL